MSDRKRRSVARLLLRGATMSDRFSFDADGERLTAFVYRASKPLGSTLLLGHGASAGQRESFVREYAEGLADRGVLVVTYDFPFVEHGRRRPDNDEVLRACCRAAIVAAKQCRPKNRLFIGGKSLGGRVACEVAGAGGEEVEDVAGVVLLGYPLHALGEATTSGARHLRNLGVPVLLAQGTRDPFGTPDELGGLIASLPEGSEIHPIDGGDHSFTVPRRAHMTQADVHGAVQDEVARWISEITASARPTRAQPRRVASRLGGQLRRPRRAATT